MINKTKLLYKHREQILFLAWEQIKKEYLETSFGMAWAVIKPMVFVLSFWYFFTIGLKTGSDINGIPYVIFIFAGYMPWFVVSDLTISASNVIKANGVLVTTIKFPVMSLPLINVLSKMVVHIIVMFLVILFYMFYGGHEYFPDVYYINFIYYWITMVCFFTALTFILSSLNVIIKDVRPLVIALMQPMFWITPVLYTLDPVKQHKLYILTHLFNPFYYFISGYRDTLLYNEFFWESPVYNLYIWITIFILYFIGIKLFTKIRPFMADLV